MTSLSLNPFFPVAKRVGGGNVLFLLLFRVCTGCVCLRESESTSTISHLGDGGAEMGRHGKYKREKETPFQVIVLYILLRVRLKSHSYAQL